MNVNSYFLGFTSGQYRPSSEFPSAMTIHLQQVLWYLPTMLEPIAKLVCRAVDHPRVD
jgi:hypothetical protein